MIGDIRRLGQLLAAIKPSMLKPIRVKFRILGVGTSGRVWLVSQKRTGSAYAFLKQLSKREIIGHHQVEGVVREKNIMASLDHSFVVNLVSIFRDTTGATIGAKPTPSCTGRGFSLVVREGTRGNKRKRERAMEVD